MAVVLEHQELLVDSHPFGDEKGGELDPELAEGTDSQQNNPDPDLVTFSDNDPANPLHWSRTRKLSIVAVASTMSMISSSAGARSVPRPRQHLRDPAGIDLGAGRRHRALFVGPLAERFGRLPVYHIGNVLGLLCCLAGALSTNISMLVAFRFLSGATLPTLTLAPTIIGDLYAPEQRGAAMSIGVGFQLIGAFIAPICGSFLASALGWRWTLWLNVIALGAVGAIGLLVLRETYAVKILERRAAHIRTTIPGRHKAHSPYHAHLSAASLIDSLTRPVQVFCRSPTVALITIYTALAYALSYIILTTLTEIMEAVYAWPPATVGLAFLGPCIGQAAGTCVYALCSDRYVNWQARQRGAASPPRPADRLLLMLLGAALAPVGFLLYGWTLQPQISWAAPLVGAACVGLAIALAILPTENYLVDAYPVHSASALSAGVILRALSGAALPLVAPSLYARLGYGWGNSVLALCSAVFIPPLVLLVWKG